MNRKLSICIPTYNRGKFIVQAIDSIINQITNDNMDKIEIVISDNASTDNTKEIISNYQKNPPIPIIYERQNKNLGADINYLKTVDLASGEYCWLLGSDDAIKHGSINRVLDEIRYGWDIYLFNRIDCDYFLKPIKQRFWLDEEIEDRVFDFLKPYELSFYFNHSTSIGALFSYLSSIVFKRKKWDEVKYDNVFTGSAYSHVFMLFSFLKQESCNLKYIKEPLVLNRQGNDSFFKSKVQRFLLDIDGYLLLSEYISFNNEVLKKDFLNVLKKEHAINMIYKIYLKTNGKKWDEIYNKLLKIGYTKDELLIFDELDSFKILIKIFYKINKILKLLFKFWKLLISDRRKLIYKIKQRLPKKYK